MHTIEDAAQALIGQHRIEQLHAVVVLHGRILTLQEHIAARLRHFHQEPTKHRPIGVVRPDARERHPLGAQTLEQGVLAALRNVADDTLARLIHVANGDGWKGNAADAGGHGVQSDYDRRGCPFFVDIRDEVAGQADDQHEGDRKEASFEHGDGALADVPQAVQGRVEQVLTHRVRTRDVWRRSRFGHC